MWISENVGVFKIFSSTCPRERNRGNEQVVLADIGTYIINRKTCQGCGLGEFLCHIQCVSKSWGFAFLHISCVLFYWISHCFNQRTPPAPSQQLHDRFLPPLLILNWLLLMPCFCHAFAPESSMASCFLLFDPVTQSFSDCVKSQTA